MTAPISCSFPRPRSRHPGRACRLRAADGCPRALLRASVLAARAQWGITTVAEALPQNPGEDAVRAVRASVWGVPDEDLGGLPLGAAFAAFTLGFIVGEEEAPVRTSGPWTRVSLLRGHVIVRGPGRVGMTAVRATGLPGS